jgi:hypothetical protein
MWSELFDIDSLHDLVLMGKSAVLGAGIVAPLGPSEAVFSRSRRCLRTTLRAGARG